MSRFIILVITFSALMLSGCRRLPDFTDDAVVARVGNEELHTSDLKGVVAKGIIGEDSIRAVELYVDAWARRQVKFAEAEAMFRSDGEIERQIREYREALLIRRLDQYYAEQVRDTTVTDADVARYYSDHRAEFSLDRTVVKGTIVRVPVSYRQQAHLKELMVSPLDSRKQDFHDTAVKNGFRLSEFDQWTNFSDFTAALPEGGSYDNMASAGRYSELTVGEWKYMVLVTAVLRAGDTAPLERVVENIRRIIRNLRTNDAIRSGEDSLYNSALQRGEIRIELKVKS